MVDVPVREQDAADVGNAERLAEFAMHGFQAGQYLPVAVPVAATGVDQRKRPGVEHQIGVSDKVWERFAGNSVDALVGAGDKSLDSRKFAHARDTQFGLDGLAVGRWCQHLQFGMLSTTSNAGGQRRDAYG